jgi:cell shape-determining protein MreC
MPRSPLILIAGVFSALFLLGSIFFVPQNSIDSLVLQAIRSPRILFEFFVTKHSIIRQLRDLSIENQALRGEIAHVKSLPGFVEERRQKYLKATVYSTYPLTSSQSLVISAGSSDGVLVGMPVLVKPGLFIGEVKEVFEHQSVVKTVFDFVDSGSSGPWQISVKVGDKGTDSLLLAGPEPRLTIISRKKGVSVGDSVTLASKQYPYGFLLGSVSRIEDDPGNVFLEATLAVPYTFSDLSEIFVLLSK